MCGRQCLTEKLMQDVALSCWFPTGWLKDRKAALRAVFWPMAFFWIPLCMRWPGSKQRCNKWAMRKVAWFKISSPHLWQCKSNLMIHHVWNVFWVLLDFSRWRWFNPSDGWVLRKSDQGWAVTVAPLVKLCSQPPAVKDGPRSGLVGRCSSFTLLPKLQDSKGNRRVHPVVRGASAKPAWKRPPHPDQPVLPVSITCLLSSSQASACSASSAPWQNWSLSQYNHYNGWWSVRKSDGWYRDIPLPVTQL